LAFDAISSYIDRFELRRNFFCQFRCTRRDVLSIQVIKRRRTISIHNNASSFLQDDTTSILRLKNQKNYYLTAQISQMCIPVSYKRSAWPLATQQTFGPHAPSALIPLKKLMIPQRARMATDTPKSVSGFVGFQSLKNFYVGLCRNVSVFCRFFCRIFVGLQFLFSYKK
jgi:hypothetical protein